jgi:hypothetical protein
VRGGVRRATVRAAASSADPPIRSRPPLSPIGDAVHGDNRVANGSASRLQAAQRAAVRAGHGVQSPHVLTVFDEFLDVVMDVRNASMNVVIKRL